MEEELKHVIESLLFVSDTPLTMEQLKSILEAEQTASIRAAVDALVDEYARRDGGFVLKQVAGGYQFRTQGRYNSWIKRLLRPNAPRLSRAALETLAIIAYNQPIIRSDIEHIRGVDSGGVIRMLMERKLIRVLGRKEIPGRPLIYATTKYFLEVFELKDLKDLPTPKEIEELSRSRLNETDESETSESDDEPQETAEIDVSESHPAAPQPQSEPDAEDRDIQQPTTDAAQPRDDSSDNRTDDSDEPPPSAD